MKTTLDIKDDLLLDAKSYAASEGMTLRALVEEALQSRLLEPPESHPAFRLSLPVIEGTKPPATDVTDRRALYDFLDSSDGPVEDSP